MNTLFVTVAGLIWFFLGYKIYGRFIERRLVKPDDQRPTAAHAREDCVDFSPAKTPFLWGHHFASIAGAGPIIGPILGVSFFGWGPTALWITLGCVFMGATHDYLSLMLSVRNGGEGIAEIAGKSIGHRTRMVFAILLWLTLVFIITVFADSGAKALVNQPELVIPTVGVSVLALGLGYAVYRLKLNTILCSSVAVVLAYILIWVGYNFPISLPDHWGEHVEIIWVITILFFYCALASLLPVWLLLQPRDFISSFNMFIGMLLGVLGIIIVHPALQAPFSRGFFLVDKQPLWPILFITVACGAISGFHTMVATGTTSKQLDKESDGKIVGFGGMIMEGVLALLVVVIVSSGLKWGAAPAHTSPEEAFLYFQNALSEGWIIVFGSAFGQVVGKIGIPGISIGFAGLIGAVMVKTFVITSLDTSTRLGRFVFVETIAHHVPILRNRFVATVVLLVPAYLLAVTNSYGNIWKMFGSSNQLIAALTLITISAYLAGIRRPTLYTLAPAVFMCVTTLAALLWSTFNPWSGYLVMAEKNWMLGGIAVALLVLAGFVSADGFYTIIMYIKKRRKAVFEQEGVTP